MDSLVAGVIGAVVGILLKWGIDLINERMRHQRDDRVWRRERFVNAAADLLDVCSALTTANAAMASWVVMLTNTLARDPESAPKVREGLAAATAEQRPLPGVANRAVETLRLYAPATVVDLGRELRKLAAEDDSFNLEELRKRETQVQECSERFVSAVRTAANVQ